MLYRLPEEFGDPGRRMQRAIISSHSLEEYEMDIYRWWGYFQNGIRGSNTLREPIYAESHTQNNLGELAIKLFYLSTPNLKYIIHGIVELGVWKESEVSVNNRLGTSEILRSNINELLSH